MKTTTRLGFTREPCEFSHADWIEDIEELECRRTNRETKNTPEKVGVLAGKHEGFFGCKEKKRLGNN